MKVIKGMPEPPNACVVCGSNPNGDDGLPCDAIFAPGVDIDWGGSLYICWECGNIIANLVGRTTREGYDKLETKYFQLKEKYEELERAHEKAEVLLNKIREGARAQREVKATKQRSPQAV
ncbi:MAG: hypothetical protein KGL39_57890 [Patescibacteria group bacterium]|nr:hypothetical protein [Patescibacteria group bacterium]